MALCVAIITARVSGSCVGNIISFCEFVGLICRSVSNAPILERLSVIFDTFNGRPRECSFVVVYLPL